MTAIVSSVSLSVKCKSKNEKITRKNISDATKEIYNIENGIKLLKYQEETKDIIKQYSEMGCLVKYMSFDQEEDGKAEEEMKLDKKRLNLIFSYLEIAKKYIK